MENGPFIDDRNDDFTYIKNGDFPWVSFNNQRVQCGAPPSYKLVYKSH